MTNTSTSIKLRALELTNFRAFPQPYKFDFEDKNVVIYGENGSGKSSVFRAIEYFFAASMSDNPDITPHANIFMADQQHLRAEAVANHTATELVEISVTFSHSLTNQNATVYKWNNDGSAPNLPKIREINNSLSLLDYHKLLQLHYVKTNNHQGQIDLWPLLQHAIVYRMLNPETQQTFHEDYQRIAALLNTTRRTKTQTIDLANYITAYENGFVTVIKNLSSTANELLGYFFPTTDNRSSNTRIEFMLDDFAVSTSESQPHLYMRVQYYDKPISEFSTFLNEARLSAIAISLYLAAIKLTPQTNVRLIVLDDVLLGIDMANRMIVLKILADKFKDWQIIMLTHDHTWFTLIKSYDEQWKQLELYQNEQSGIPTPMLKDTVDGLVKAEEYLKQKDYSAAGFYARNTLEYTIKSWVNKKGLDVKYKARTGTIHIDLSSYLDAMEKYFNNNTEIQAQIKIIKRLNSSILNRMVHDTERTIFGHEIQEVIESIRRLRVLLGTPNNIPPATQPVQNRSPQPAPVSVPTVAPQPKPKPTPAPAPRRISAPVVAPPHIVQLSDDEIELHAGTLAGHTNPSSEVLVFRRKQFPVMQQNDLIARITQSDYYHQSVASDIPNLIAGMATFMNQNNQIKLAIALCVLIDIQNIMQIKGGDTNPYNVFSNYLGVIHGDYESLSILSQRFQHFGLTLPELTNINFIRALTDIVWRYDDVYHTISDNSELLTKERITPFIDIIKPALKSRRV